VSPAARAGFLGKAAMLAAAHLHLGRRDSVVGGDGLRNVAGPDATVLDPCKRRRLTTVTPGRRQIARHACSLRVARLAECKAEARVAVCMLWQLNPGVAAPGWRPLARWAKLAMTVQAVGSLMILGLVIAQAVNIVK
jgi:hypothetical protein